MSKTSRRIYSIKCPKNAFMFFCEEKRNSSEDYTKEYTGPPAKSITILSILWKNLDNNEKQKYNAMALKDKKRYQEECDAYEKRNALREEEMRKQDEIRKQTEKKEREIEWERNKDLPKPKKPMSAFLCFCRDKRKEITENMNKNHNGKVLAADINEELAQQWKLHKKEHKKREKIAKESNNNKPDTYMKYIEMYEEELREFQWKLLDWYQKTGHKDPYSIF